VRDEEEEQKNKNCNSKEKKNEKQKECDASVDQVSIKEDSKVRGKIAFNL
jgi:hypothetical protein